MDRRILQTVTLIALVFVVLCAHTWGSTLVVGSCKSGVKFATIQAAVDAAPSGSTIQVCPGTYPEQVAIDKPLVLKGISSGTAGAVVITAPATGLVPNFTGGMYGTVAAQLLVHDTTGVTINDFTIDGTGTACPAPAGWAGIAYESYSGAIAITNVAVRNVGSYPDCKGASVLSELGGSLTLQNSSIRGFYYGVISSEGGTVTISGNLVQSGLCGIYVVAATGKVVISNNSVVDIDANSQSAAIFLASLVNIITSGVTISGNTVEGKTQAGIDLDSIVNAKITGNKVSGFRFGLFLDELTNSVAQTNTIRNAEEGIFIADYGTSGGNTVTNNTVNEADCGVYTGALIGSKVAPNSLYNVTATTCH